MKTITNQYCIHTPKGYLAVQGNQIWYQETSLGWTYTHEDREYLLQLANSQVDGSFEVVELPQDTPAEEYEEFDNDSGKYCHPCGFLTSWFHYDVDGLEWLPSEWSVYDVEEQKRIIEYVNK
tara:strand:+ start:78 stop:443 length:366 start_codon:yes stop_codon:yes gene_type:complete